MEGGGEGRRQAVAQRRLVCESLYLGNIDSCFILNHADKLRRLSLSSQHPLYSSCFNLFSYK
jgi:hypothetical protein